MSLIMEYYQLSDFYKRDTYFYLDEIGGVDSVDLEDCESIDVNIRLTYSVDRLDKYIRSYDILPTIGGVLVSDSVVELFKENSLEGVQFLPAVIESEKGEIEGRFLCMNILRCVRCLDKKRSVYDIDEDGYYDIKKAHFDADSLVGTHIARMAEHKSFIVVSDQLKNIFDKANLKGFEYLPNGHTIYTDLE